MIYTEINKDEFIHNFKSMSEGYSDKFSIDGLCTLYDYLNDYSEDTGENIKLDEIAICCEYTEYDNIKEIQDNYSNIKDLEDLQDHTTVIEVANGHIIIQNF